MTDEITIELEDDVIDRLREMAQRRGQPLDELVHEILRSMADPLYPKAEAYDSSTGKP